MNCFVKASLNVPSRKCVLFKTHEIKKFVFRNMWSTFVCNSYVRDVRKQMELQRCDDNSNMPYKDGQFLVIDVVKRMVLLAQNTLSGVARKSLLWANYNDVTNCGVNLDDAVFLNVSNEKLNFAIDVSSLPEEKQKSLEAKLNSKFISLRTSLFILDGTFEMPLVSQSHSLLDWRLNYKFCNYCGNILENEMRNQKKCPGCKVIHYPTVSPIGISLICDKQHSKVLLVRQPIHPPRMFTCVAGFLESGETIEDNVKREVAEEVGLEVKSIQYIGSQHWSLPGSKLMIGCLATVEDDNYSIDTEELEEAHWFSPEEIHKAFVRITEKKEKVLKNPEDIWIPPPGAIAHTLIKWWLQKYHLNKNAQI